MSSIPGSLAEALKDRYPIERELGRGGMATVYLARDLKHDRPLALKVLLPELARTIGPDRFQREVRLAARLQHPHILTVHDSGETAGQLWFTMPFVEGESLRDRLTRECQLPVEDALRITAEASQALQYAHEHGVVHRDIKPENLLLTRDGNTLVADFGIARALGGDEHLTGRLTETGMAIGTPAYMSPEQASGEKAIDARSDIYSLAAVLYEMLAGEAPYTGPTAQAVIMKRFTEPVPSARRARPTVPESVDRALQRALAPVPADRFHSMAEFGHALHAATTSGMTVAAAGYGMGHGVPTTARRSRQLPVAAMALALGFLIGLGVLFAWRSSPHETAGGARVLAVLPFENLGDSADAYFADGVANEIRSKLARVGGLEVIASASSNEYRHSSKRPQEIARELGATYLLTATVQWNKAGGASRVRVSPELVEVSPDRAPSTKWGEPFDAAMTDVFQVQADIAGQVATALNVALGDSVRHQLAARPTGNLAAYDAFLKGEAVVQGFVGANPAVMRRAIGFYEQAVSLDSALAPAWAQLSRARSRLYSNGVPTPALATASREAMERSRAVGPDRPETQLALGDHFALVVHNPVRALDAYEAGLKLAPNNADLLTAAAASEATVGRPDQALEHLRRAAALDPRSIRTARNTGNLLLRLRRYPEAAAELDRALALAPDNFGPIENRAMVPLAQGDLSGARGLIRTALERVDSAGLLSYLAVYNDLYWVLDDAQQRVLLQLPPSAFDDDRGAWGIVRAQTLWLRGETTLARIYADSAQIAFMEQTRAVPDDHQSHLLLGLSLAYLGRKAEAISEGQRGVALLPVSRDAVAGPYDQQVLARIYLLTGEPEKALDQLEPLLKMPGYLSSGWLRIDPTFAPLKGNPRFERLVAGK